MNANVGDGALDIPKRVDALKRVAKDYKKRNDLVGNGLKCRFALINGGNYMLLSSQTSNLFKTAELAKKYAPIFKEAGFDALDYNIDALFPQGDVLSGKRFPLLERPSEEYLAYFDEITKILQENGIEVGQTHAHFSTLIAAGDKERNEYLLELLKKEIEITAAMGSKYIVIHPICRGYNIDYTWEMEKAENITMYTALIDTLKKYDVICCLENMWGMCNGKIVASACGNMIEAAEYIDTLNEIAGEERFGFCFDVGHSVVCSVDPVRSLILLGDRVKALHLHDVEINRDSHTAPFRGVVDWDGLMRTLYSINYEGNLNFEASACWNSLPEPLYPSAIKGLGDIGKYFMEKYF